MVECNCAQTRKTILAAGDFHIVNNAGGGAAEHVEDVSVR